MAFNEKQQCGEVDRSSLFLLSPEIAQKYASVLAKIKAIYGEEITRQEFLNIPASDFADQQGVGVTNVERFLCLRNVILSDTKNASSVSASADLAQWEIPVTDVPERYRYLYKKICFEYSIETYADILMIDQSCFKKLLGVGERKAELLVEWQSKLIKNPPQNVDNAVLQAYRVDFSQLSRSEKSLIVKFVRRGMRAEEVTPVFVMNQRAEDLLDANGFGKKTGEALLTFQKKIRSFVRQPASLDVLVLKTYGENLTLPEISACLLADIERFAENLQPMQRKIFIKRAGLHEDQITLQEIGNQIGVTRERIRQRSQDLFEELSFSVRIAKDTLGPKIKQTPIDVIFYDMSELRQAFSTDACFIKMLAHLAGIDVRGLRERVNPTIRYDALDEFFCSVPYPAQKVEGVSFLQEEFNLEKEDAERSLLMLEKTDRIRLIGSSIKPVRAKKEVAAVHVLAGYPMGLSWQELTEKVNEFQICQKKLSTNRSDQSLYASDYVFQTGNSTYRHMRYFGLSKKEIQYWLDDLRKALEESKHNAFHLRAGYYAAKPAGILDYHKIRHIARNFGYRSGIYFQGKSRVDTVSLDPDAEQVSQKEALARALCKKAMKMEELLNLIHSHSEVHARLYLGDLLMKGRIVRLDGGFFAAPSIAFASLDVDEIKKALNDLFLKEERLYHLGTLSQHLDRLVKQDCTPRFCRSFILSFAKEQEWHISGFLVAGKPFEWGGVADVIRSAPSLKGEKLILWVQKRVCITREAVKRAIYNNNLKEAKERKKSMRNELSSEMMKELLDL